MHLRKSQLKAVLHKRPFTVKNKKSRNPVANKIMRGKVILGLAIIVVVQYETAIGYPQYAHVERESYGAGQLRNEFRDLSRAPRHWMSSLIKEEEDILAYLNCKLKKLEARRKVFTAHLIEYINYIVTYFDYVESSTKKPNKNHEVPSENNASSSKRPEHANAVEVSTKTPEKAQPTASQQSESMVSSKPPSAPAKDDKKEDDGKVVAPGSTGNEETASTEPKDQVKKPTEENDQSGTLESHDENKKVVPSSKTTKNNISDNAQFDDNKATQEKRPVEASTKIPENDQSTNPTAASSS